MILGLLAAFGTLFSWSGGTLAFLHASRKISPSLLNRTRLLLAVGSTGLITMIVQRFTPVDLIASVGSSSWFWLGLSGLVGLTIGDFFGFTSLRTLGARRQSIIGTVAPAFAAIAGFILLDEHYSLLAISGLVVTIIGVMYAMAGTEERDAVHREGYGTYTSGILMAIGGAVCQGVGLVLAKNGMTSQGVEVHPIHATFMRMSIGFLGAYVLDFIRRDKIRPMKEAFSAGSGTRAMFLGALLGPTIGVSLSLYAAREIGAGLAQTIFSLIPFVIMAFAAIRSHEKLRARSVIGAIIAVGGVVVLIMAS
ncbi:MAG: EamA family transporter [Ignavibacteriae bacterium]|nr:MAG: EamA family transporter [Ignavibacteriota bacterium]